MKPLAGRLFYLFGGVFLVLALPLSILAESELKIGLIASLTGPAGEEGETWVSGATLAAEELSQKGIKVKLIVEDDQTQPVKVASAFNKLVRIDKVSGIIGGTWDFLGEAAYPLASQFKIPLITPTNPPEILSALAQKNPYVFTAGLSLASEAEAIRVFLKAERIKSMILLVPNIPWGTFHAEMMRTEAKALGIRIIDQHEFSYEGYPEVLKSIALKISKNPAEIVFAPIDYNGIDIFTREFKKLKINPKLLTTQHLDHAFSLSSDYDRFSQCFAVYPKSESAAFAGAFKQRFGRKAGVFSGHGYDSLIFLVQLLTEKVDFSKPARTSTYPGVTGEFNFPPQVGRALTMGQAQIMTTTNGKFEPYSDRQ